jgi:hypothetical protein
MEQEYLRGDDIKSTIARKLTLTSQWKSQILLPPLSTYSFPILHTSRHLSQFSLLRTLCHQWLGFIIPSSLLFFLQMPPRSRLPMHLPSICQALPLPVLILALGVQIPALMSCFRHMENVGC